MADAGKLHQPRARSALGHGLGGGARKQVRVGAPQ
jgi:hypothetical protein